MSASTGPSPAPRGSLGERRLRDYLDHGVGSTAADTEGDAAEPSPSTGRRERTDAHLRFDVFVAVIAIVLIALCLIF